MRYESGTKYIFLILQMLVKYCVLEAILRHCGSGFEHRLFPIAASPNGSFRLMACVYTMSKDNVHQAKIINTRTGEIRVFTNKDYENVLSQREREVLRLIDQGKLSKEIADQLSISINTVNRHRQNILEKLNVDHAIEACKVARAMGLL